MHTNATHMRLWKLRVLRAEEDLENNNLRRMDDMKESGNMKNANRALTTCLSENKKVKVHKHKHSHAVKLS